MVPKSNKVYVNEVIHILQISKMDFDDLIKCHKIELLHDEFGLSISKNDYKILSSSKELKARIRKALEAQSRGKEKDELTGLSKRFNEESSSKLIKYRAIIKTIILIHKSYNNVINPIENETPEAAAYILFARALSLLNMAVDSLEDQHFEAILLLRPIDEAISLAEYFLIEKNAGTGKTDLDLWFRENISPSNAKCRKSIDKYTSSIPGAPNLQSTESLMNRVYQAKSKPVHNAHHSIMETYNTQYTKDGLIGLGFDYGCSTYPRKINELVTFYQSSIWTLVQSMLICFAFLSPILSSYDFKTLSELNMTFSDDVK